MTTVAEMYDELAATDAEYDEALYGPKDLGLPVHGFVVRAENDDHTDGGVQTFLAPSWEVAEHEAEESLTASGHPDWHVTGHVTMPDIVLVLDALDSDPDLVE